MKTNLSNNFNDLNKTVQEYLKVRLDLFKLSILEKMTRVSVMLISSMVLILLGTIFFLFSAAAFVVWYGLQYQDYLTGLLIVIGLIILIGLFFFLTRSSLVTTSIIKNLSAILFDDDENE